MFILLCLDMHPSLSSKGGGISFTISWNVGGLGHAIKRAKIFSHLKFLAAEVIFLQETHFKPTRAKLLRCSWVNPIFQSTFSSKAGGVAILISQTIPFRHVPSICDPNGRFILVTGHIYSHHATLLNVYGPKFDDPNYFSMVFNLLPGSFHEWSAICVPLRLYMYNMH